MDYSQGMRQVVSLLILFSASVNAEIFRWVDEDGRIHFGDQPPAGAETDKIEVRINTYESPNIEALQGVVNTDRKVVMYSASWCHVCHKARKYFQDNRVPFTEYDIDGNAKAKREFDKAGGKGVPVILVGDKRLNGFSPESFRKIYDTHK